MRLKVPLTCLTVAILAAAGMTIWSGCDVGSATEDININPSDVTLSKGQTAVFTVSGGYDYAWGIDNYGAGKLNTYSGDTVVFEMLADPGSSSNGAGVVTITCTAFIQGTPQGSAGTNSPSNGYTRKAYAYAHYTTN